MGSARRFSVVAFFAAIIILWFFLKSPMRHRVGHQAASPVVFGADSIVNPKTYSSDSTGFRLSVNPSDRNGRAGASYELTSNGEQVWASDLPFTLLDVVVTDTGEVVGYSYSHGVEGFGRGEGHGDFRVVILDPTGRVRLNEGTNRQPSRFLHTAPNPIAKGLIVDKTNDRVIFRVADPDVNRQSESWWVYKLSTGKPLGRRKPRERMSDSQHISYLIDARLVRGTPLILLHWWRFQFPDPRGLSDSIIGGRFTLVDENADPVWNLDLPRDYSIPGDEDAQDRLMHYVQRHGAVLRNDQQSRFDLYFASQAQRVTYSITRGPGVWNVNEVGRQPITFARIAQTASAAEELTHTPLTSLGQIELQTTREESPIRSLSDFTFDQLGRIAFIRRQKPDPDAFVLVNTSGEVLCEVQLNVAADENSDWRSCSWVSGDRFLVTRAEYGPEKKARAWWVDSDKQKLSLVVGFDSPPVERLLGFSDGGFVALATMHHKYTMTEGLYGFDEHGRPTWVVTESSEDRTKLFSPEDIAVASDNELAVLDNIRNTIQLYNHDGKFVRDIKLEQTWGREPNYLSGISAYGDGFVIHDFQGSPPYVVTDKNGRVKSTFTPHLESGRLLDESHLSVAPDGTIWATDGDAIFRLKANGVTDRVLGLSPESNQLTKIAGSAVDSRGRIYVVDGRTAIIHVFDLTGVTQGVCIPDADDFRGQLFDTSISVSDSGEISLCLDDIGSEGRFVRFSASGKRLGSMNLNLNTKHWYYQPGTKKGLALTYDKVVLLDSNGAVIREITRRPDGDWLSHPARVCFAPDGAFAVLDSGTVNVYQADGAPVRSIFLPSLVGRFPRLAFNGDRIVVSGEGNLVFYDGSGALIQASKLELSDNYFQPHIIADGQELLIVHSDGTAVHRFAMP